ncbi:hypothetical protein H2201_006701 [Coniosporium apollinis]|uniref:chitinase n=1 Tax=Coniosporium apollinis TaxID=61459 RepID=A0ABQ9NSU3_9PEZI|nr:hypothetical protein H2201_006701 [Coniosporium apollinis]
MRSTSSFSTVAAAAALIAPLASATTFNAASTINVAMYWGQGAYQAQLIETCKNPSIDIVNLAFLNVFPDQGPGNYPGSNFGNACGEEMYEVDGVKTMLRKNCPSIGPDIKACQEVYGKKVLLSLGGGWPTDYYLKSADSAKDFAEFVWAAFGPVTDSDLVPRPFGDAVVDGFDFDIESYMDPHPKNDAGDSMGEYQSQHYADMVNHLKSECFPRDGSKQYYISGAPQCITPDSHLADAIANSPFDFLFVQFYNTPQCSARAGYNHMSGGQFDISFDDWVNKVASGNPNRRIYLGLPASTAGLPPGSNPDYYLTPCEASKLIEKYMKLYPEAFGGVMLWEAQANINNVIEGKDYATWMKETLSTCQAGSALSFPETCSAATSTSSIASSTSSATATSDVASTTTSVTPTATAVSEDGACGAQNGRICAGSQFGDCCSEYGYCGSQEIYCGTGCNPLYGKCGMSSSSSSVESTATSSDASSTSSATTTSDVASSTSSATPTASAISEDGMCGAQNGRTCLGSEFGDCCSEYGFCGSQELWCGTGCNPLYGKCGMSSTTTSFESASSTSSASASSSYSDVMSSSYESSSSHITTSPTALTMPPATYTSTSSSESHSSEMAYDTTSSMVSSTGYPSHPTDYPSYPTGGSSDSGSTSSEVSSAPYGNATSSAEAHETSYHAYPTAGSSSVSSSVSSGASSMPYDGATTSATEPSHRTGYPSYPTAGSSSVHDGVSSEVSSAPYGNGTSSYPESYPTAGPSAPGYPTGSGSSHYGPVTTSPTTSAPAAPYTPTSLEVTTTVITTSYVDICPTGFTTVVTTYTTTVCPTTVSSATSSGAVPDGWTTTVTVCDVCGPEPTTVTLTKPAPPTTTPVDPVHGASSTITQMTTSTVYTTKVITVTACPASMPNCPAGSETTQTITSSVALYTTVCPVSSTPAAASSSMPHPPAVSSAAPSHPAPNTSAYAPSGSAYAPSNSPSAPSNSPFVPAQPGTETKTTTISQVTSYVTRVMTVHSASKSSSADASSSPAAPVGGSSSAPAYPNKPDHGSASGVTPIPVTSTHVRTMMVSVVPVPASEYYAKNGTGAAPTGKGAHGAGFHEMPAGTGTGMPVGGTATRHASPAQFTGAASRAGMGMGVGAIAAVAGLFML